MQRDDLEFKNALGEGSFAQVVLARHKTTGAEFAVKIVSKNQVLKLNKLEIVNNEKKALSRLKDHPNIVSLIATFQDAESLYFVLELAPCGELFRYIAKYGPFSLEAAQFYAAEVVSALEYMHSKEVIHRDLKPENILLSKDMHAIITDFGSAKLLDESTPTVQENSKPETKKRSQTSIGTVDYTSPEALKNSISTKGSDLWALGCIIYQSLVGRTPFKAESEYLLFQKILNREFTFPPNMPETAQDLIDKLLQLDPDSRLGCGEGGYEALKAHPFFDGIDWQNLHRKKPPYFNAAARQHLQPLKIDTSPHSRTMSGESSPESSSSPATSSPFTFGDDMWRRFLCKGENILYSNTVLKRRRLTTKKRQLILTDMPRLIYVDPVSLSQKGQIPMSPDMYVEKKNARDFTIVTPKRTYVLEDLSSNVDKWQEVVHEARMKTATV